MKNNQYLILPIILLLFTVFGALSVSAQTTEFTYQGRLTDGNIAATGNYDLQFSLFDDQAVGNQQGATISLSGVPVSNGIFTVRLDFGAQFTGAPRYLQIAVKSAGNPNPYTVLNPRQTITSAPYAIRSLNSGVAETANNSNQLGGINANQYTQTNDARLTDDRNPLPNSPNYIQNSTSQQSSSNFNISGTGNANAFNAAINYQIGGTPVLSVPGNANVFVGNAAGIVNTSGANLTFAGTGAGQSNTIGIRNSFFGALTGNKTTVGNNNSFYGSGAGAFNTTGSGNAFFGDNAGSGNTVGGNNTLFGNNANVTANNLTFASAIGAGATVSTNNTIVLGRAADTVQIPGSLFIAGTFGANIFDAATQFNINGNRVLSNGGISNLFAGEGAGAANTTGNSNSFFGFQSGQTNQTGNFNSFFGNRAGNQNTGNSNSFFGSDAGLLNSSGGNNVFVGTTSGNSNTTGSKNSFIGAAAGAANTVGNENSFFGYFSGKSNNASFNSFFGAFAGQSNIFGSKNSFFGWQAGNMNLSGTDNSFFGFGSGSNNTTGVLNSFFGKASGSLNSDGDYNSFFGVTSGSSNTGGSLNTFVGYDAGRSNTTGSYNAFFGEDAGNTNTTGQTLTIIGGQADVATSNLNNATALGFRAVVSQSNSLVLGGISGIINGADTNVGIGTTAPQSRFHIKDNSGNIMFGNGGCNAGFAGIGFASTLNCTNYSLLGEGTNTIINRPTGGVISFRENNTPQVTINAGGTVSINTLGSAGLTQLCRNASNQISTCSSSLRYKMNINPFNSGLNIVNQLQPITFNWKSGGMADLGFGAEDVAKVNELLVIRNDKGEVEGVKYDRLSTVFVNAFKEQQTQIQQQQTQIAQQQLQIQKMQDQLTSLGNLIKNKQNRDKRRPIKRK